MVGDAPIFGMHYSLAKPGSVSVGDKVLVAPAAVAAAGEAVVAMAMTFMRTSLMRLLRLRLILRLEF